VPEARVETETNRIHLVLFGMKNRTLCPYLLTSAVPEAHVITSPLGHPKHPNPELWTPPPPNSEAALARVVLEGVAWILCLLQNRNPMSYSTCQIGPTSSYWHW
jgi:hypothetical protein